MATVWVINPLNGYRDENLLQKIFGLTRGEERVANALMSGLSLQDIAERHRVSRDTVKTQRCTAPGFEEAPTSERMEP